MIEKRTKRVRQDNMTLPGWAPYLLVIKMDDEDADVVDSMLYYIYTQQLDYGERFVHRSVERDVEHFLRAISLGDKCNLPLFGQTARTELEYLIHVSDGRVLLEIVHAMHLDAASKSLVAMRNFVIEKAATLFRKGG